MPLVLSFEGTGTSSLPDFSFFSHWVLRRPVLFFVAALPDSAGFP